MRQSHKIDIRSGLKDYISPSVHPSCETLPLIRSYLAERLLFISDKIRKERFSRVLTQKTGESYE
jgi:hypothetical protein